MKTSLVLNLVVAALLPLPVVAGGTPPADNPLGIFTGSTDVGPTHPGAAVFDKAAGIYTVTGGGADMWGTADGFHFTWIKVTGDAALTADIQFPAETLVPLEKAVLIFRQSLDPGSPYADVAIHADGHTTLQFRAVAGGKTDDAVITRTGSTRLRIERKGDKFTAYAGAPGQPLTASAPTTVVMSGPVYLGIGVCAHNAEGVATVSFSNVKIEK